SGARPVRAGGEAVGPEGGGRRGAARARAPRRRGVRRALRERLMIRWRNWLLREQERWGFTSSGWQASRESLRITDETMARACRVAIEGDDDVLRAFLQLCALVL